MKRIPLRHLPLFWLGLLPVVMLLWAWADSDLRSSLIVRYCRVPEHYYGAILSNSAIRVMELRLVPSALPDPTQKFPFNFTAPWGDWDFGPSYASHIKEGWFPRPRSVMREESHGGNWKIQQWEHVIPLWLILLGYLPFWITATWWQARRKARMMGEEPRAESRVISDQ